MEVFSLLKFAIVAELENILTYREYDKIRIFSESTF